MLWNWKPLGCPTQARKRHWAICGDSRIDQVGTQLHAPVLLSTLLESPVHAEQSGPTDGVAVFDLDLNRISGNFTRYDRSTRL